jgi:hypothetical protein
VGGARGAGGRPGRTRALPSPSGSWVRSIASFEGAAPDLARHYPSADGTPGDVWNVFRAVLEEHRDELRELIARPVQTNEVGRSASLLGGFLTVAQETHLQLRLLEIGASAGLNLRWDRYRYESNGWSWGALTSPVRFTDVFREATPEAVDCEIAERAGCDLAPVDPTTEEGRLTLLSYVWPDQVDRLGRLREALEVARTVPATVERADAATWPEERLPDPPSGAATVVFHSIVFFYLDDAARARVRRLLEGAGAGATAGARLPCCSWRWNPNASKSGSVCGRGNRSVCWPRAHRTARRSGGSGRPPHLDEPR